MQWVNKCFLIAMTSLGQSWIGKQAIAYLPGTGPPKEQRGGGPGNPKIN